MIEQIWDGILELTSKFVIPDWGSVIALLPVVIGIVVVLFFIRVTWAWATAGPTRRGGGRRQPLPPAGVHAPGPSYAPIFAAIGAALLFLGLVFGGWILPLGVAALVLTLLYWGREALVDYDHVAGAPQVPAVVHEGPPPGVHMPGPSFRPILASLAVAILFAGLVFGGWLLAVGVISTIVTLIGWLGDFRREYGHVVEADQTGHVATDPAPRWPKAVLWFITIAVVAAIVVDAGWLPPRSAASEGGGASPGPSAAPSGGAGEVTIVAQGVKFDRATVNIPADTPFKLTLDNRDPGTPHDFDILNPAGGKLFDGKDFPGVAVHVYDVPAIPAGTYPFICSIHPDLMKGEVVAG